jgi:hypothetical protein
VIESESREKIRMADKTEQQEVTDYLLGELEGEEKTILELRFDREPELRSDIDEFRTVSDLIYRELRSEESLQLNPEQRRAILKAIPYFPEKVSIETGIEIWDRFELLFLFLGLLSLGLLFPRLSFLRRNLRAWFNGTESSQFHWSPIDHTHLRAFLISSALAMFYYSWIRLRFFPKRPVPVVHILLTFVIYGLFQILILRF